MLPIGDDPYEGGPPPLVTIGLIWTWLVLTSTKPADLTSWRILVPLFLAGLGNGFFIAPNIGFIVATVEPYEAGSASGVVSAVQRIGSAMGIAIIGSVLFGTLVIKGNSRDAVATGFVHSASAATLVSAALSAVALLLVFALPKRVASGR